MFNKLKNTCKDRIRRAQQKKNQNIQSINNILAEFLLFNLNFHCNFVNMNENQTDQEFGVSNGGKKKGSICRINSFLKDD